MSRVTSLTNMPEEQLNRWIKRIALLFVVVLIAFVAFYVIDRFRMPTAEIVDQQLVAMEEKVRAEPENIAARGLLADTYAAKGRYEDAIVQYTLLIDADQEVELATLGRARVYQAMERYDDAVKDYDAVVELAAGGEMANVDRTLAAAYFGRGEIALAQGNNDEAIDQLGRALEIERTNADAMYAIAKAYLATDRAPEAVEILRKAIALVPAGWAEPYALLETAYKATGDAELAEWAGAMAAFNSGDIPTAEQRLKAITGGEHAIEAFVGLGLIAETTGDTAAAADWYRKALAIDPEDDTAKFGLSRVTVPVKPSASPAASPSEGSN